MNKQPKPFAATEQLKQLIAKIRETAHVPYDADMQHVYSEAESYSMMREFIIAYSLPLQDEAYKGGYQAGLTELAERVSNVLCTQSSEAP